MADIKAAVVRYALPSTTEGTGTFTVSIPGSPGWTPKACIVFCSGAYTDDTAQVNHIFGVGWSDGTSESAVSAFARDAVGTTECLRSHATDAVVELCAASQLIQISAVTGTGVGPTTDGWVFNCSAVNTGVNRQATFVFLGGSDLSAAVASFAPNTSQNGTQAVTYPGFEPDVVLFHGAGVQGGQTEQAHNIINLGCAWNDTSPVNVGFAGANQTGAGTVAASQIVYTDRVGGQVTWAAESWAGEVTAFGASGFTMTTRDGGSSGDELGYLALNFGGGDVWVGNLDSPTSTGSDWNPTNPSFTPLLGLLAFASVTANDALDTTSDPSIAIGATDGTRHSSINALSDDGVATSEEFSYASASVLKMLAGGDRTTLIDLRDATLDSNGFTVPAAQISTAPGTAIKGWGLFIGDAAAGGGATAGQPVETDTAHAITARRIAAAGQALESGSAGALTGRRIIPIAGVVESNTAAVVAPRHVAAILQPTEADTAQGLGSSQTVAVGQPLETDAAVATNPEHRATVGRPSEADSAQPVATSGTVPLGRAASTETAPAITSRRIAAIGQPAEQDAAQAATAARTAPVAAATENDSATPAAIERRATAGQATEQDAALGLPLTVTVITGQAVESDAARALTEGGASMGIITAPGVTDITPRRGVTPLTVYGITPLAA